MQNFGCVVFFKIRIVATKTVEILTAFTWRIVTICIAFANRNCVTDQLFEFPTNEQVFYIESAENQSSELFLRSQNLGKK
jgi:hypothetical protein